MHKTIGAIGASLAFVALSGASPESSDTATTGSTTTAAAAGDVGTPGQTTVRVADITGNPDRYMGQTVTVEADLEEVLSPYSFKLDEDAPLAGGIDNDLRVLYPKSLKLAAIDDQWLNNKVRVTGTVRRMAIVELEREVGWDLDPKLEAEFQDKPFLIGRSVERVQ
jgi:hypothetical protein